MLLCIVCVHICSILHCVFLHVVICIPPKSFLQACDTSAEQVEFSIKHGLPTTNTQHLIDVISFRKGERKPTGLWYKRRKKNKKNKDGAPMLDEICLFLWISFWIENRATSILLDVLGRPFQRCTLSAQICITKVLNSSYNSLHWSVQLHNKFKRQVQRRRRNIRSTACVKFVSSCQSIAAPSTLSVAAFYSPRSGNASLV